MLYQNIKVKVVFEGIDLIQYFHWTENKLFLQEVDYTGAEVEVSETIYTFKSEEEKQDSIHLTLDDLAGKEYGGELVTTSLIYEITE